MPSAGAHRNLEEAARAIADTGRRFYQRGWVWGTAGNFSTVLSSDPLALAITASSLHKGELQPDQVIVVDERGKPTSPGRLRPSAECLLHVRIVRDRPREAGAVLHTHSVWGTILSEHFAAKGGVELQGYEILKGLAGVSTHQRTEFVPILDNDQDMDRLQAGLGKVLARNMSSHAVLLRKHGLYTWGETLADAERHIEVLEFLFEVVGRTITMRQHEGEAIWHS
jgi:methylthioribulose-1-phosphate dehydratase